MSESNSRYFDDTRTEPVEDLATMAVGAFKSACSLLQSERGEIDESWQWGRVQGTDIRHLAWIPGLDRDGLFTDGRYGLVNATSRHVGPSWRMVVGLGPELKASGIYPGGQSGNPGSRFYDNAIDDWVDGRMYPLHMMASPNDTMGFRAITVTMSGGRP